MFVSQRTLLLPLIAALLIWAPHANAYEPGYWIVRVGASTVDPKSDSGTVVSIDSGTTLVCNGTCDLRWMNIETDVDVDGTFLETVEIDPLIYSLTFGWKF